MHEINMNFTERQYFLVMPRTRALNVAEETDVQITRLLLSTRDSSITGSSGPFVLAAVAQKTNGILMLFGSAAIYASDMMDTPAYANREYLVRAALWLSGGQGQELVSIPPKTLTPLRINSGLGLVLAVLLVFAVVLPFTVLAAGAVLLFRRRSR